MTRETIVAIRYEDEEDALFVHLEAPARDTGRLRRLRLRSLPCLDTSANVRAYGTQIREALSGHPAIRHELTELFRLARNEHATLQFLISGSGGKAESYRWETLCDTPPRFLAFDPACTISRVASVQKDRTPRDFTYPLRMAAFLSASGISAKDEFDAICREIAAGREGKRGRKLGLECTIFVGEQKLLDEFEESGGLPGIQVALIPPTAIEIGDLLERMPIQFLHFFCHGGKTEEGVPALLLATTSDHEGNEQEPPAKAKSSIIIGSDRISSALSLNRSVWITVFNCCSGAEQIVPELSSLAMAVTERTPYTIGMAEPIDQTDATAFSKEIYHELFHIVADKLAGAAAAPVTLDLAASLLRARQALHDRYHNHPAFGRWALPLIYQSNPEPLRVRLLPRAPEAVRRDAQRARRRAAEVARTLRILPPDTPEGLRTELLKILEREPGVPPAMRPDRYGRFN